MAVADFATEWFDSEPLLSLIAADGEETFPFGPKIELAARILDRAERMLERTRTVNGQSSPR